MESGQGASREEGKVPGAVDLLVPYAQCPRVVFLGLEFKMFLDCSAIDDGFVDARTLLASSLEEIIGGLLRHCRQQMKQADGRSEERAHKDEAGKRRGRRGGSAQAQ